MCTGMIIKSKTYDVFLGRTLDVALPMFGEDDALDFEATIVAIPKGVTITSQLDNWKAKYNVLGVASRNTAMMFDGINEFGLTGDTQVLEEANTSSKSAVLDSGNIPLLKEEFVTYVLSHYKSVEEIRQNISMLTLVDQEYLFKGEVVNYPCHFLFVDRTGESIVLEPVLNGSFKCYDSYDVMTNSPEYNYHTTNIRNYIGLKNEKVSEKKINNDITLQPIEFGFAYGLFGVPGDYTSPSRFIRSFIYKNCIDPFESEKGFNSLYSVFRPLIIPRGVGRTKEGGLLSDYTRYWAGYDLTNLTLLVQPGITLTFTTKKLTGEEKEITYYDIAVD